MEAVSKNIFRVGDTVRVIFKPQKAAKTPTSPFEGTIIAFRGESNNKTFTVRKLSSSKIAVERIFPLNSPTIQEVKVLSSKKVRRAKLYYLRNK